MRSGVSDVNHICPLRIHNTSESDPCSYEAILKQLQLKPRKNSEANSVGFIMCYVNYYSIVTRQFVQRRKHTHCLW